MSVDLGTLNAKVMLDLKGLKAGAAESKSIFKAMSVEMTASMSAAMKSLSRDIMLAGGIITAGLAAGFKAGSDFEKKLNDVRNNTTMSTADFKLMEQTVKELGANSSAPLAQLADGFMHITNFGFKAAESQTILKEAMKSAVSTGSDTANAANILAAVMHEFSIKTTDAAKAMNVLHLSSALGNMTLEQFNQAAGPMLAYAAGIGLKLTDVASAMSALTRHGFDAAEASTQVRNQIAHIINPSKQAKETLVELSNQTGINLVKDFSVAGLASRGLYGVIGDLKAVSEKTGKSLGEITKDLIPAMRGGIGTLVLAGRAFDDYTDIIHRNDEAMQGLIDPTSKAYIETTKTSAFQAGVLKNNLALLGSDIQKSLGPAVNDLVVQFGKALRAFMAQSDAAKSSEIRFAAVAGAVLLVAGAIGSLIIKMAEFRAAWATTNATMIASRGGLLALMLASIGASKGHDEAIADIEKRREALGLPPLHPISKDELNKQMIADQAFMKEQFAGDKAILDARKAAADLANSFAGGSKGDSSQADLIKERVREITQEIIKATQGEAEAKRYAARVQYQTDLETGVSRKQASQAYQNTLREIAKEEMATEKTLAQERADFRETLRARNFAQWDQLLGREVAEAVQGGVNEDMKKSVGQFWRNFSDMWRGQFINNTTEIMTEIAKFNKSFSDIFRMQRVSIHGENRSGGSGDADQVAAIKRYSEQWEKAARDIQRFMNDAFEGLFEKGPKGFIDSFVHGFHTALTKILSDFASRSLRTLLMGEPGGGVGGLLGGLLGGISSLFGGGHKSGGGERSGGSGDLGGVLNLAGLFGGLVFDDAGNDRKARRWGFDFAQHFTHGIGDFAGRMQPAMASAGSGGQSVQHFHIEGPFHIREEADINKIAERLAWHTQLRSRVR